MWVTFLVNRVLTLDNYLKKLKKSKTNEKAFISVRNPRIRSM